MRIVLVNIPLRDPDNQKEWIPLPPKGYGGIQWVVTNLLEGYLDLGHRVWILGAPSTKLAHRRLTVVNAAEPDKISRWLKINILILKIDIIHDHSDGIFQQEDLAFDCPIVTTHHLTGKPKRSIYPVYLSYAQREQACNTNAPVIRIPVNTNHYIYCENKEDYLLYLGRVSRWKGVYQAAQLAAQVGLKLIIAGPAWEKDYLDEIFSSFSKNVEFIGEVGGEKRLQLLSQAKAVIALSQSVLGPWGALWCEPGSTVISEAAVSGTPVIASTNGCLKEIAPKIGIAIDEKKELTLDLCLNALSNLPSSPVAFVNGVKEWHYLKITNQYINYFKLIAGKNDIKGGEMIIGNNIKEQLLLEGGVVAPSILNLETLAKVDQVTKKLIQSWESNKNTDEDFWWYREEKLDKDILYRIHHLETKDPVFAELIDHPAIQELRHLIFGKPTKATAYGLVYKAPGGSAPVPWHRDSIDVPPNTVYNFSIYLDESDRHNGALEIVPGSHLDEQLLKEKKPENTKILSAQPGDVTIHDVCVYHGSSGSLDTRMRRSIIIEFQPDPLPPKLERIL